MARSTEWYDHPPGPEAVAQPLEWFDYPLAPEMVAQRPVEPRDAARMLDATASEVVHRRVRELDKVLQPGDVVVVNDTRVLAARLSLTKPSGGAVEVLLLEPTGRPDQWQALVRPSRRVPPGTRLLHAGRTLAQVGEVLDDGRRLVDIDSRAMELAGEVPLPPYITASLDDPNRYQTVFARNPGSVAAPTAGLHLTTELLGRLRDRAVDVVTVELKVGLGTFRPITVADVAHHRMHAERYQVEPSTWARIQQGQRVVAVGTTVVRTLESVARTGRFSGSTELFIRRGFDWQVVDLLLTNFHVPRSSLLVLVDAFVGSRWRELYREALEHGYRFLSFGDCMLLERSMEGDRSTVSAAPGEAG